MLPQGGHRGAVLLKHEGCDRGWNLHLTFVFGFLLNKGVAVGVACSVTLKKDKNRTTCGGENGQLHACSPTHTLYPLPSKGLSLTQSLCNTSQALPHLWCISELFPVLVPQPLPSSTPTSPLIRDERVPRILWTRQSSSFWSGPVVLNTTQSCGSFKNVDAWAHLRVSHFIGQWCNLGYRIFKSFPADSNSSPPFLD